VSGRVGPGLQIAAACLAIAAYAGLSYYCNAAGGSRSLGTLLVLAPLVGLAWVLAWRATPAIVALLLCAGSLGLGVALWPTLERHFVVLSMVQESGLYALMGVTFARTLQGGQVPLCTRLADRIHGPLSDREFAYTRRVTAAWVLFFFVVTAVSLTLYAVAPLRIWSAFSNFCTLPLVGAMFLGEYLVRRKALPQQRRAGLVATVRVYFTAAPRP
jgi:uncharacterized membrane protein